MADSEEMATFAPCDSWNTYVWIIGSMADNEKKGTVIGGFDKEYHDWIAELSARYRQSQIKAAIRVNSEMLRFYWSVGKDIEERKYENKYGSHFYENLSRDLLLALNKKKGFSPTSLWYTKRFYCLYSTAFPIFQQVVGKLGETNLQQVVGESTDSLNTNCHSSLSQKNCRANCQLNRRLRTD